MPGIEEDVITTSNPEEMMPVHVIPDEGEIDSPDKNSENSSDITYLKKDAGADTSA